MSYIEIFLISISVAMDAFAVSICKGLSIKNINIKKIIKIALYFGIFQALMPLFGYFFGAAFSEIVKKIDHWLSFICLFGIGFNMIKNTFKEENESTNEDITMKTMFFLAIATSIDAFAIGITFAFLNVNIIFSISVIGITTFFLSIIGVIIGKKFGYIFKNKAEILGGIILCFIGIKILLEHLGFLTMFFL